MSEGLPIKLGATQLGMPKWAERVWPYEEGMQPGFWLREEEFANQHVRTSIAREIAAIQTIENMRKTMEYPATLDIRMPLVITAYDVQIKEIYTAHRKAIREIKDRYPGIR